MARVTVEDCIDKVESPYELVLVAKERTTQLNSGVEPSVSIEMFLPVFVLYPLMLVLFSKKYGWKNWKEKLFGRIEKPIIIE
mgnify:CR=1 FL=1